MKILFLLFAVSCLATEYTITERFFSPVTTFDATIDGVESGTARKQLFSLQTIYDLEDVNSNVVARATARCCAFGTSVDIEDPEGLLLGRIEEYLWKIPPWVEYRLFNAENQWLYTAELNLFGNQFELFHPDQPDTILATMTRPIIHIFRDSWTVSIVGQSTLDPRFLILLAVYQTDKENRARFWGDFKQQFYEELESYDTRRF